MFTFVFNKLHNLWIFYLVTFEYLENLWGIALGRLNSLFWNEDTPCFGKCVQIIKI